MKLWAYCDTSVIVKLYVAEVATRKECVEIATLPFITGDKRQFLAAQTLGLGTLWVGE